MGKDSFYEVHAGRELHVRPEKIQDWITRSWLNALEVEPAEARGC